MNCQHQTRLACLLNSSLLFCLHHSSRRFYFDLTPYLCQSLSPTLWVLLKKKHKKLLCNLGSTIIHLINVIRIASWYLRLQYLSDKFSFDTIIYPFQSIHYNSLSFEQVCGLCLFILSVYPHMSTSYIHWSCVHDLVCTVHYLMYYLYCSLFPLFYTTELSYNFL